jgi:hypothetical protein
MALFVPGIMPTYPGQSEKLPSPAGISVQPPRPGPAPGASATGGDPLRQASELTNRAADDRLTGAHCQNLH